MVACLALSCSLLLSAFPEVRTAPVRFADLPPDLLAWLPQARNAAEFERLRDGISRRTAERLRQGDHDAAVFLALQGSKFTAAALVEPVLAAHKFVDTGAIPPDAAARFADFDRACRTGAGDARMRSLCAVSEDLGADFKTTARFLYDKEISSQRLQGDSRRDFVDSLYRARGLSSDSSFDANFPVYLALRQLATRPGLRLERVLIVGPGLEYAPRTGLNDATPPQSIQPYAVADALLQLGLATRDRLQIHCADINPRVIAYFQTETTPRLKLLARPGPDEYQRYFEQFGKAIGESSRDGANKLVKVTRQPVTADRLNIVTERQAGARYDLVIATNILVYLDRQELALAMANVGAMLADGGFFVHNELRAEIEPLGSAVGMPVMDARMVRLREDDRRALFDGQVIHRKGAVR